LIKVVNLCLKWVHSERFTHIKYWFAYINLRMPRLLENRVCLIKKISNEIYAALVDVLLHFITQKVIFLLSNVSNVFIIRMFFIYLLKWDVSLRNNLRYVSQSKVPSMICIYYRGHWRFCLSLLLILLLLLIDIQRINRRHTSIHRG